MEESPVDPPDSTGESKPETTTEAIRNSFTGSIDNLLYGNETESLVTQKLLGHSEQSHSEDGKNDSAKSTSNTFPLLQPRCLKTSHQQLQNDIFPTKDSEASTTGVVDSLTSCKTQVENENKFEMESDATFSGTDSDQFERPTSCVKLGADLEKKETDLSKQSTKAKSLQSLSLVAEYADSGNDTEEELQKVTNQDLQRIIQSENQKPENCSENIDKNAAITIEQTSNKNTSDSKIVLSDAGLSDQFSKIPCVTTAEFSDVDMKNCKWSEDEEELVNTKCEIVKKMESGSNSDEIDENNDQLPSSDLDSSKAKKNKHSFSNERKQKKRRKKKRKTRTSFSYSDDQDGSVKKKRKDRNRSRCDSSEEKSNKNYHSGDSPGACGL